jgi:hypothetical protein
MCPATVDLWLGLVEAVAVVRRGHLSRWDGVCGAPGVPQADDGFLVLSMLSVSGGQLTSDLPAVIERPEVIRLKQYWPG